MLTKTRIICDMTQIRTQCYKEQLRGDPKSIVMNGKLNYTRFQLFKKRKRQPQMLNHMYNAEYIVITVETDL